MLGYSHHTAVDRVTLHGGSNSLVITGQYFHHPVITILIKTLWQPAKFVSNPVYSGSNLASCNVLNCYFIFGRA